MKANHILVDFENVLHLQLACISGDSGVFSKQPASFLDLPRNLQDTYAEETNESVNS